MRVTLSGLRVLCADVNEWRGKIPGRGQLMHWSVEKHNTQTVRYQVLTDSGHKVVGWMTSRECYYFLLGCLETLKSTQP